MTSEGFSAKGIKDVEERDVNEIATWIANSLRVAWGCQVTENIGIPGALQVRRRGDDKLYFVSVEVDA